MCEIVLCVKDRKTSGDLLIDSHSVQQGDVVDAKPDGFDWGRCVLGEVVPGNPNGNHNFFRIIKLPNVSLEVASQLLSKELDVDPLNPSPYLQYRGFYIDKDKIGNDLNSLKGYLADDTRANPFITLTINNAKFQSLISQRVPIPYA